MTQIEARGITFLKILYYDLITRTSWGKWHVMFAPRRILLGGIILMSFTLACVYVARAQDKSSLITLETIKSVKPFASFVGGDTYSYSNKIFFSPDGTMVAALAPQIILGNVSTGEAIPFAGTGRPVAFSPDSKLFVFEDLLGTTNSTHVWEIAENRERFAASGNFIALSPDSKWLLTSSEQGDSGVFWVWEVATGKSLGQFAYTTETVQPQFSPNSAYLVWADFEKTTLLDLAHNTPYPLEKLIAKGAVFAPDSRHLITGSEEAIQFWELPTLKLDRTLAIPGMRCLAINPEGSVLVLAALHYPLNMRIIDIQSGNTIGQAAMLYTRPSVQFAGNKLFMRSEYGLQTWDAITQQFHDLTVPLRDGFALSPDGSMILLTRQRDGVDVVEVYETHDFKKHATMPGHSFVFSSDGTTLASLVQHVLILSGVNHPAKSVILPGRILPSAVTLWTTPSVKATSIGTVKGSVLVSGRYEGFVYLPLEGGWIRSEKSYFTLGGGLPLDYLLSVDPSTTIPRRITPQATATPYGNPVRLASTATPTLSVRAASSSPPPTHPAVQPLPDGRTPIAPDTISRVQLLGVISINVDRAEYERPIVDCSVRRDRCLIVDGIGAHLWDISTIRQIPMPPGKISKAALSPDGERIAYFDAQRRVIGLWEIDNGRDISVLAQEVASVNRFLFSSRGRWLVSESTHDQGGWNTTMELWDGVTGGRKLTLGISYLDVLFSVDEKSLVTVGIVVPTEVWDIQAGQKKYTLTARGGRGLLSQDGTRLVTIDFDAIYLWDLVANRPLGVLSVRTPLGDNSTVLLSPDGNSLLTLDDYPYAIRLWDMSTGKQKAEVNGFEFFFAPDGRTWFVQDLGRFKAYDTSTGRELYVFNVNLIGSIYRFIDERTALWEAGLLDVASGQSVTFSDNSLWGYPIFFAKDATTLMIIRCNQLLVLGVPTTARPARVPISAHVKPSKTGLWEEADPKSKVIGTAGGTVTINARNEDSTMLYSAQLKGWLMAFQVDLDAVAPEILPVWCQHTGQPCWWCQQR